MKMNGQKRRLSLSTPFLLSFLLLLAAEIFIALNIRDAFIRPYLGDVLVVILLYCLLRSFWRNPPRLLPLWLFLLAAFVEGCQFFELVKLLQLEHSPILRTILGSTFDWSDILCYAVGATALFLWQAVETRLRKK